MADGYEMTPDRELVVHFMRDPEAGIKDEDFWAVYCLADGFGPDLPPEMLAEINGGYDWSHVRDSSPEAWTRMAAYLREHGYGLPGNGGPKTGR